MRAFDSVQDQIVPSQSRPTGGPVAITVLLPVALPPPVYPRVPSEV
jgi:hypothetical protein